MEGFKQFVGEDNSPEKLEEIKSKLAGISPAALIDMHLADETVPFIAADDQQGSAYVYYGPVNGYHTDITHSDEIDSDTAQALSYVYENQGGGWLDGLVGRIGLGVSYLNSNFKGEKLYFDQKPVAVIDVYPVKDTAIVSKVLDVMKENKAIDLDYVDMGAIPNNKYAWFLVMGDQVVPFNVTVSASKPAPMELKGATDEEKDRAAMQIALHTGRWPNGKPVDGVEKKRLQELLGLKVDTAPPDSKQQSIWKKLGLPGKYWSQFGDWNQNV